MNFYAIIENIKTGIKANDYFSDVIIDDCYRSEPVPSPMRKIIVTVGLQDVSIKTYTDTADDGTQTKRRMMSMTVGFDIFVPKTSTPNLASVILKDLLDYLFTNCTVCTFESLTGEKTVYDSVCGAYRLSVAATTKEVAY